MTNVDMLILVAGLLMAVGLQLGTATHGWHEVLTPGFVAGFMMNVATVIYASVKQPPPAFTRPNEPQSPAPTGKVPCWAMMVAVGTLTLAVVGCASAGRLDQQVQKLNHDAITLTEQMHASQQLTDAQFQKANVILNRVAVSGRELTKLLRAGKASAADVDTFLGVVRQATADLQAAFPGGTLRTVLDAMASLESKADALRGKLK